MTGRSAERTPVWRAWGTVLTALVTSTVVVMGTLWGYAPFSALRPTSTVTALGENPPCIDVGMAGNAEWDSYSASQYELVAETTRDLGVGRIRIGANWGEIERTAGNRDWSDLDMRINAAHIAGLTPLLVIQTVPAWLQVPSGPVTDEHRQVAAQFGEFAGSVAARYGTMVDGYEIWNEPNLHKFWPNPDVGHYVELLKAAYPAIHAADSGATVVTGGLAPAPNTSTSIAPLTFLERLYALGGGDYADAIGMHPYSYPELPSGTSDWNTFRSLTDVSALMAARGDGAKKIWLTEYGAPTGGNSGVSPQLQADMVAQAIELARANDSLGPIFIYTLIDGGAERWDSEFHFGIYYADQSPKPAVAALQSAIAGCEFGGGSTEPPVGGGSVEPPIVGGPRPEQPLTSGSGFGS